MIGLSADMAVIPVRAHHLRGPVPDGWVSMLACLVITIRAAYGAFALRRDQLAMESIAAMLVAGVTGAATFYDLTR